MLKEDLFKDEDEGIKKVKDVVKTQVERQKGNFNNVDTKKQTKHVWYLDTENHEFYKINNFLLRVKEDPTNDGNLEYDVTFKIRDSVRFRSASYDLLHPVEKPNFNFKRKKCKFEQDIVVPFDSKFSVSSVFEYKQIPGLNNFQDIKLIYPNLSLKISDANARLLKVNDFVAKEISLKLGEIGFANGKSAQLEMSIWYFPNEDNLPTIVEFDIDVEAEEKPSDENENTFEEFPISKVGLINGLYNTLQEKSMGIVGLENSKTKTEYAYNWKQK